ncbi:MAG: substrate-binding domain-containing protein [Desulfobulbus sp.]|jgi:phosphate transport system substrate-binding protein
MHTRIALLTAVLLVLAGMDAPQAAAANRDYISIVGSSTVYPFATTVAEHFGRTSRFRSPRVESTGTGGGIRLFCAGMGRKTPDIAAASRPITPDEIAECRANGVREIVEVRLGYDGIVLAHSRKAPAMHLSSRDLFVALARRIPDPDGSGQLVDNPWTTWNQIDASLPETKIKVLGPGPGSGTRAFFLELIMNRGCDAVLPAADASTEYNEAGRRTLCRSLRGDGVYIETGENDDLIVQKLEANPETLGMFGYSFLDRNRDRIQAVALDGDLPNRDSIASGRYIASRPLFFYVKKAHVSKIPGLSEFLAECVNERTWGETGYLADKGLIPAPRAEREAVAAAVRRLEPLSAASAATNHPATER